ncbi:MAG TPA: hypothetical protein VKO45_08115 [Methanomicrobiales archaeon]|nr:hypothetical protein [Methanomicrobiales archaeon]
MVTPEPSGGEDADLTEIREVKIRYEERLLSMAGVVSVGIGKGPDGRPAIVVGLDRPRPEILPEIPGELEGYRVRVEIVGRARALGGPSRRNIKP